MQQNTDDRLASIVQGILHHPAFDDTVMHYLDNVLAWRRGMGYFNRVGTHAGLHISGLALYLHFANEQGAHNGGATYSRLLEICEARHTCGPRTLRTVLGVCQVLGYLKSVRSGQDRRAHVFIPTDKLITLMRQQFANTFGCLDRLVPGATYAAQDRSDPEFFPRVFASGAKAFVEFDIKISEHLPDLLALMKLQGGFPTYATIVAATMRSQDVPSAHAIAREFKISSSQVRAVLRTGAERGLFTLADRGEVSDAAPLVHQHKVLIAREFGLFAKYALGLEDYFDHWRSGHESTVG
jgi:hypothetical protein